MSSAAAALPLRPGVARGACPERPDPRRPGPARALRAVIGALRSSRRAGRTELAAFVEGIDREAEDLAERTDAHFDSEVAALRSALSSAGLRDALVRRGFALVREAARRTLGTPHYDVQLYGGWIMIHQGLAELEMGEGKTLAATLPAAVAALAGIPVHVITANDYLVERDARAMAPLFARLGITTGFVVEREPSEDARRAAYACEVTYVTNKQVAFDYLRDRIAGAGDLRLARALGLEAAGGPRDALLRGLCFAIIDEADSVLIDDARTPLILSRLGAPTDEYAVTTALQLARELEAGTHYRIDRSRARLELTQQGRARLESLARDLDGPFAGPVRREEWVQRALCAEHLFQRDRHYLVHDGAIEIIDLPTGRRAPDRAFEAGIQSLIEAKENIAITPQRETIARISYQRFFQRYLRLAGMTGTAREVARELWKTYDLRSVTVPTRIPSRRRATAPQICRSADAKWQTALERIRELHAAGRPVLIGTSSVATSEHLSALLAKIGLAHQVLNARQDQEEARVVARAGGLAVISAELGESRRIDRQLFGRCGRQGDPGSCEQLVSLEDRMLASHLPTWLPRAVQRLCCSTRLGLLLIRTAQRTEERRSALARRRLLASERALQDLLGFAGRGE